MTFTTISLKRMLGMDPPIIHGITLFPTIQAKAVPSPR